MFMAKVFSFKVTASRNISGKRELERYEDDILTKIVAGKGKKDDSVKLLRSADGEFIRPGGVVRGKEFEASEVFLDVSWMDATPKERKHSLHINGKKVSVVNLRLRNNKVVEKGESVTILSECSPPAAEIKKAFMEQLGRDVKGSLSTDFFKIEKL
jgi:hypothetical protein